MTVSNLAARGTTGSACRVLLALVLALQWVGCTTPQHGAKRVSGRITRLQGYGAGAVAGVILGIGTALALNKGKIDSSSIAPIAIGAVVGAAAGGALAEKEIGKRQDAANLQALVDGRLEEAQHTQAEAEALLKDLTTIADDNAARLAASPSPDELKALKARSLRDADDAAEELKKLEEHIAYQRKLRDEAKERNLEQTVALDSEISKLEGTMTELAQKVSQLREQSQVVI